MSKARKELGKKGEALARQYLKSQGYKIKEQNFRTSLGEIDLIG
jgi:Holliday junction resolvase-like predicted endonuclease